MDNFNLTISNLESTIYQILQAAQLPVGAYYLLLNKMLKDIEAVYMDQVNVERQAHQEAEAEAKNTEDVVDAPIETYEPAKEAE